MRLAPVIAAVAALAPLAGLAQDCYGPRAALAGSYRMTMGPHDVEQTTSMTLTREGSGLFGRWIADGYVFDQIYHHGLDALLRQSANTGPVDTGLGVICTGYLVEPNTLRSDCEGNLSFTIRADGAVIWDLTAARIGDFTPDGRGGGTISLYTINGVPFLSDRSMANGTMDGPVIAGRLHDVSPDLGIYEQQDPETGRYRVTARTVPASNLDAQIRITVTDIGPGVEISGSGTNVLEVTVNRPAGDARVRAVGSVEFTTELTEGDCTSETDWALIDLFIASGAMP